MYVCLDCGERVVPGPVGVAIGDLVARIASAVRESERAQHADSAPLTLLTVKYRDALSELAPTG